MNSELRAVAARTKGFMPIDEGDALHDAGVVAARSGLGPLVEIGTYCGLSAIKLGSAARAGGTVLFTVAKHRGSEGGRSGACSFNRCASEKRGQTARPFYASATISARGPARPQLSSATRPRCRLHS